MPNQKLLLVLLFFCGSVTAYTFFVIYTVVYTHPEVPNLKISWWGPGAEGEDDTTIRSFKIHVSPDEITDLLQRLQLNRITTPPLEGIQHQYGINANLVQDYVQYWMTEYNWTERELFLNQYPQFKTQIQGLNVHFVHVKPQASANFKRIPLLLLHGWPSSIREFYKIIPLLTTPQKNKNFVFEVVAASLPGFGFSDAATRPGCGPPQMGMILDTLMKRLGYQTYYVQGGDWGAVIASYMAILHPNRILGIHLNMCMSQTPVTIAKILFGSVFPTLVIDKKHESKLYPLSQQLSSFLLETGYFHIQATKPDTIGVALTDSPSGLAAYMLEKFITLTNPNGKQKYDGGLPEKFSKNDLLDNIMIYWITGSMTTAMRIYAESSANGRIDRDFTRIPIKVPCACAKYPHEIVYMPDNILRDKFHQLVQSTEFDRGGHFAALEEPQLLSDDIWAAVDKMIKLS